jgi:hypothetical protein
MYMKISIQTICTILGAALLYLWIADGHYWALWTYVVATACLHTIATFTALTLEKHEWAAMQKKLPNKFKFVLTWAYALLTWYLLASHGHPIIAACFAATAIINLSIYLANTRVRAI